MIMMMIMVVMALATDYDENVGDATKLFY